ncbi:hypothetical protein Tco_0002835 [Tanacetum coccineum]
MAGGHAYHEGEKILKEDRKESEFQWAPRNQGNRNGDGPRRNALVDTSTTNALVVQDGIGYQIGFESLEARIVVHEKNEAVYEEDIAFLNAKDKVGLGYDSQINKSEVVHSVFNSRESDVDDSLINDRFKTGKGFHAVPPPYTRNYMPSRPNLSFAGLDDSVYKTKALKSAPIIKDWDTDSDNDSVFRPKSDQTKPKFTKINFVKSNENVKSVIKENTHRQVEYHRKRQVPVNTAKQSSPRAVASISTAMPVNTAAPKQKVNDALPITYSYFKAHSPVKRAFNQKSVAKTNKFNEKVNTARVNNLTTTGPKAVVSATVGNGKNVVKSLACWIWRLTGNVIDHTSKDSGSYMLKRFDYVDLQGNPQYTLQDQGIFDSGCSRHMTGNKSFLTDYQEIDGGFVAFGGSPKGCIKDNVDAVPTQQYILLPLLYDSPQSSEDAVANDAGKKTNEAQDPLKEGQEKDVRDQEEALRKQFGQEIERLSGQGEATNTNSTNRVNTISSSVNDVSSSFTTVDPRRERAQRNEFESVFVQDKDTNGNSTYKMSTPINAARSSYENLGGSIPVNVATFLNDDFPTDPLMPDLEDTTDL